MSEVQGNFDVRVLPVLVWKAKRCFRRSYDRLENTADAISLAWEFYQRNPDAPPSKVADFALRQVIAGRQFRQSVRSLTGPKSLRRAKLDRFYVDLSETQGGDVNPAELATLRVDFQAWVPTLTRMQQAVLQGSMQGDFTWQMAQRLGVTPGRISQIRRELVEDWEVYTS